MLTADVWSSLINGLHSLPTALIYVVVFVLVFAETAIFLGFVFPGETAVLVVGALAAEGRANVVVAGVVVVVGAATGGVVGYVIGERIGERLLAARILTRHRARLERALDALRRRGVVYVFVGRFTAFLRAVMPALAGMSEMTLRTFLAANLSSALIWGVGYTAIGYAAAHELSHVEHTTSTVALGVLIAVAVLLVLRHFWLRRREKARDAAWRQSGGAGPSSG